MPVEEETRSSLPWTLQHSVQPLAGHIDPVQVSVVSLCRRGRIPFYDPKRLTISLKTLCTTARVSDLFRAEA